MCGHMNSVWNVIMTLVSIRATAYAELSNALALVRNDRKIMSTLRADFSVELFAMRFAWSFVSIVYYLRWIISLRTAS